MYACNCTEWHRNWPKLQNTITVAWSQDVRYDGAAFKNCPWCGEKLRRGMPSMSVEPMRVEEEEKVEVLRKEQGNYLY